MLAFSLGFSTGPQPALYQLPHTTGRANFFCRRCCTGPSGTSPCPFLKNLDICIKGRGYRLGRGPPTAAAAHLCTAARCGSLHAAVVVIGAAASCARRTAASSASTCSAAVSSSAGGAPRCALAWPAVGRWARLRALGHRCAARDGSAKPRQDAHSGSSSLAGLYVSTKRVN